MTSYDRAIRGRNGKWELDGELLAAIKVEAFRRTSGQAELQGERWAGFDDGFEVAYGFVVEFLAKRVAASHVRRFIAGLIAGGAVGASLAAVLLRTRM